MDYKRNLKVIWSIGQIIQRKDETRASFTHNIQRIQKFIQPHKTKKQGIILYHQA